MNEGPLRAERSFYTFSLIGNDEQLNYWDVFPLFESKFLIMINRLPRYFRNVFFLTGAFFLLWMVFFDSNDIYTQYKLSKKLNNLEERKAYYIERIEEVKQDREELFSNPELLEKFAREKYLMKKPTEDIYVIVEEKVN